MVAGDLLLSVFFEGPATQQLGSTPKMAVRLILWHFTCCDWLGCLHLILRKWRKGISGILLVTTLWRGLLLHLFIIRDRSPMFQLLLEGYVWLLL